MKSHRVWLLGNDIDTDVLAPGAFMKGSIEELSKHCLEAIEPGFAEKVKTGDVIVAGQNFGAGSSREQAALVLKLLGIEAIIAQSFGGIFFRNAFNIALPLFTVKSIQGISAGDQLTINIETIQPDFESKHRSKSYRGNFACSPRFHRAFRRSDSTSAKSSGPTTKTSPPMRQGQLFRELHRQ